MTSPLSQQAMEAAAPKTWREVLKVPAGSNDNSLALGGNSIRAAQVTNRLRERIQRLLPPGALFAAPTIRQHARELLAEEQPARHLACSYEALVRGTPERLCGFLDPAFDSAMLAPCGDPVRRMTDGLAT